jgi:hypothetical protein
MGIFDTFGSWFAPNISGPINQGLQTGYNLAAPQLQSWENAIQQLYPQAREAVTQYGQQGIDTLKNLYNMYAPTAQTYASATSGATGPGSAWNAFTQTPFFTGPLNQGTAALRAQEARSGKTGSGAEALDLSKFMSNYNAGKYTDWINSLLPGVTSANAAATGLAGAESNLGTNLGTSFQQQAGALGGPLSSLANLGWGYGTGQGAAGAQQGMLDAITGGNVLGGLLNFAGSSGGSSLLGKVFSDVALKENIDRVGELYDGLGIFRYNYIGDPTPRIGVIAQDVEKKYPDAVVDIGGYKAVNYGRATDRAASIFDEFLKAA